MRGVRAYDAGLRQGLPGWNGVAVGRGTEGEEGPRGTGGERGREEQLGLGEAGGVGFMGVATGLG